MSKRQLFKDKILENIQLVAVILFIAGSLIISKLLQSDYSAQQNGKLEDRVIFVDSEILSPQRHQIFFETTGDIEARGTIDIVSEVSGRVINVHESFFAGGNFKSGEVLFEIDPRDFQFEIDRLKAEVAKAKTKMDLELAEVKSAIYEWKQINGKRKIPELVARKPQLEEAKSNLESAKAQLQSAELDLERAKFILPFDGKVVTSQIAPGQYVVAGQSYGKVFDVNSLEVSSSLEDNQLRWLLGAAHPEITIITTYLGEKREYKAWLKRSASVLEESTRFATVKFSFIDKIQNLLPGVFADVKIKGEELDNILLIPPSALQNQGVVWEVVDSEIRKIIPEIIYSNMDYIAIKGQNRPVNIVTSRISGASDGMKVKTSLKSKREEGANGGK